MGNDIEELLAKSKREDAKILEENTSFKNNEDRHFHRVRIVFIWVASSVLIIVGLVMVWHLIAPHGYRWLTPEETINLKNMAVTGILGAVLGKFGNKLMV